MLRPIMASMMRTGVRARGRPMMSALNRASLDCRASQELVLMKIIENNRDTVFGRDHDFQRMKSREDFRRVPISSFEDLRPYTERAAAGEADVLFPGLPIFFATTSGTTGKPKLVPIADEYNRRCYNGLSKLWMYSMLRQTPDYLDGHDLTMVGKAVEGHLPDGTSYGSFSGQMNAHLPEFIKKYRCIPYQIHDIDDYRSKYYALMRVALSHPIKWVVAANPTSLIELHKTAMENWDDIAVDIEEGTLKRDLDIDDELRLGIEQRLKPDRSRAMELLTISRESRPVLPKHYWPRLKIINTWKNGNAAQYLKRVEGFYPAQTAIWEFGYIATEARMGIVLDARQEASILAAHMIFFEFIKKDERFEQTPRVYFANELEQGEDYYIFVTTQSGMYRYDLNDIVRVEGFYNEFPMVRFIQKGTGVTSLTGEKLYETQYIEALGRVDAELKLGVRFHAAYADLAKSCYRVFLEAERWDSAELIGARLDELLCELNMEYKAKRGSNRLRTPVVHRLPRDAYEEFKLHRLENGARDGQFKMVHLAQDQTEMARLMDRAQGVEEPVR